MKIHKTLHSNDRIKQRFSSHQQAMEHFEEALIELKKKRIHAKKAKSNFVNGQLEDTYLLEYKGASFIFAKRQGTNILITAYQWRTRTEMNTIELLEQINKSK